MSNNSSDDSNDANHSNDNSSSSPRLQSVVPADLAQILEDIDADIGDA